MTILSRNKSAKENQSSGVVAVKSSRSAGMVDGAESEATKPFVKMNFIFMGISLLLIIVGFLLMTGSSNNDPAHFNYDIFSTRRIVVGPALAFIGFVAMAFAIVYSPRRKRDEIIRKESVEKKED